MSAEASVCPEPTQHHFGNLWRNPPVKAHQVFAVAVPDNFAAATRADPMPLRPCLRQQSEMVNQSFSTVRDTKRVGICFHHPGVAMWPFTKRPFPGLLEPELAEEIFVERAV